MYDESLFERDNKKSLGAAKETEEYVASIRETMKKEKTLSKDPHWKNIDIDELTDEDVLLYDEFIKGILDKKEVMNYWRGCQSESEDSSRDFFTDSRRNLLAMILNKFISGESREKYLKKHPEDHKGFLTTA